MSHQSITANFIPLWSRYFAPIAWIFHILFLSSCIAFLLTLFSVWYSLDSGGYMIGGIQSCLCLLITMVIIFHTTKYVLIKNVIITNRHQLTFLSTSLTILISLIIWIKHFQLYESIYEYFLFFVLIFSFLISFVFGIAIHKTSPAIIITLNISLGFSILYLAWDEPLQHSLSIEELSPTENGDDHSYAVLMQASYVDTTGVYDAANKIRQNITLLELTESFYHHKTLNPREYLQGKEYKVIDEWMQNQIVVEWITKLNSFERISDSGNIDQDSPRVSHSLKSIAKLHCAYAFYLNEAGKNDMAVSTLIPFLELCPKLRNNSPSSIRTLMSIMCESMILKTLHENLNKSSISHQNKEILKRILSKSITTKEHISDALNMDYRGVGLDIINNTDFHFQEACLSCGISKSLSKHLISIRPILFNVNRTVNQLAELNQKLSGIAINDSLTYRAYVKEQWSTFGYKNFIGSISSLINSQSTWSNDIYKINQEKEDLRTTLITRLETMP